MSVATVLKEKWFSADTLALCRPVAAARLPVEGCHMKLGSISWHSDLVPAALAMKAAGA